ncbi:YccF domain-containing protein [Novispirillum itersonii]|uniref:YccF domain-containing protein n=1 Tax=Novispirillum itersonii TaxID=189 RepID=UPI0003651CFD|nr:YccF domain-containing protein [Novispirillum itersonii]
MISLILNLIWLLFGGVLMFLGWMVAGVLMVISIIGIPWARSAFTIGLYALWPFGRAAVDRSRLSGQQDLGTGPMGTVGNILWFLVAGWWLALGHLGSAIGCAVTIIGLPLAWAHLKLAVISLAPVGKTIIDSDTADRLPPG